MIVHINLSGCTGGITYTSLVRRSQIRYGGALIKEIRPVRLQTTQTPGDLVGSWQSGVRVNGFSQ